MNPPFYVAITLKDDPVFMTLPFIDADTLTQAQDKALYWFKVYNRKKSHITAQDFKFNQEIFTDDKRYCFVIQQYPF